MELDKVFNLIGHDINESIKEPWASAELKIQADSTYVDLNGFYINKEKNKKYINVHVFGPDVKFAIMELNESMSGTKHKWNRAIFKMWPDNKFDMEFIWDQELFDEIERLK